MTADDLRAEIARLGCSQVGLSRYLRSIGLTTTDRNVRRWVKGEPDPPAWLPAILSPLKDGSLKGV